LDELEKEKIVRNRRKSKTNHQGSWRSLPLTCVGAAPFRFVGGAASVAATRHWFLSCAGGNKAGLGWQRFEG
jgi:hypothetical protein